MITCAAAQACAGVHDECCHGLCFPQVVDEVTVVPSKRMRNKIAGFVTVCDLCELVVYMVRYRASCMARSAAWPGVNQAG